MPAAARPFGWVTGPLAWHVRGLIRFEMKKPPRAGEVPENETAFLLALLQARFDKNPGRHVGIAWAEVEVRLKEQPTKLRALGEMEQTGGEPDVVGHDVATGEYLFFDCSPESPKGRTGACYDREGLASRKEHKPACNAVDLAAAMGVELLNEAQYHQLQGLGEFDTKTSSWLQTPAAVRRLGGALFGDRGYGRVFVYHNGAPSYFGVRGFRASLRGEQHRRSRSAC